MSLRPFFLILFLMFISACAPSGPVKFYDGATRSPGEIARVRVPGPITVLEIDGRKINSPSQEEGFYELHLPPGNHRITFKYELYWGSADSGLMIKSDPSEVSYDFAAGKVYELVYQKPTSEDEAFTMASDFQATLVESDGGARIASHSPDQRPLPVVSSAPTPSAAQTPVVASPLPNANQAVSEDAVKRLKFWWLMAGEKEREEFRKWMQNEMPSFKQE